MTMLDYMPSTAAVTETTPALFADNAVSIYDAISRGDIDPHQAGFFEP